MFATKHEDPSSGPSAHMKNLNAVVLIYNPPAGGEREGRRAGEERRGEVLPYNSTAEGKGGGREGDRKREGERKEKGGKERGGEDRKGGRKSAFICPEMTQVRKKMRNRRLRNNI